MEWGAPALPGGGGSVAFADSGLSIVASVFDVGPTGTGPATIPGLFVAANELGGTSAGAIEVWVSRDDGESFGSAGTVQGGGTHGYAVPSSVWAPYGGWWADRRCL